MMTPSQAGGGAIIFMVAHGIYLITMGTGASGVNYAEGGNGSDTINGAASTVAVTAYGGDGTDIITGGTVGDYLDGGNGTGQGADRQQRQRHASRWLRQ